MKLIFQVLMKIELSQSRWRWRAIQITKVSTANRNRNLKVMKVIEMEKEILMMKQISLLLNNKITKGDLKAKEKVSSFKKLKHSITLNSLEMNLLLSKRKLSASKLPPILVLPKIIVTVVLTKVFFPHSWTRRSRSRTQDQYYSSKKKLQLHLEASSSTKCTINLAKTSFLILT